MPIPPDFKHAAEPRRFGKYRIGPIRLVFLLLLAGLTAFWFWDVETPSPSGDQTQEPVADANPSPKPKRPPQEPDPGKLTESRTSHDEGVKEQTTNDQNAPPKKRRYEFYRMLRDYEVVLPEEETMRPRQPPAQRRNAREAAAKPRTKIYMLQVGSFRTRPQADALRAQLATLGLEAVIKQAQTPDGRIWQRVQVGPYRDAAERDAVIENLEANGHRPILVHLSNRQP